ncbi:hypothetical protein D3C79_774250 [compost metagenome]
MRLPTCKVTEVCGGNTNSHASLSSPEAACAAGMETILLPLPFDSCGKSATGNSNMRPAAVIDSNMSSSPWISIGASALALSGRVIIALPARLRATKSLKVQTKP